MPSPAQKCYELSQYKVLDYFMTHVVLQIDLTTKPAHSSAQLTIKPNPNIPNPAADLRLDGEHMVLTSLKLNGCVLESSAYELLSDSLIIKNVPRNQEFSIETTAILSESTDLFGLYETDGIYLIKAETEGLRRVFYCIDRPDNLATYTTTIIADQQRYPVLLSNGTLIETKQLPNNSHRVTWLDNLPKPSYLFALVAGSLNYSATSFKTTAGREIPIEFYVSSEDISKCEFAKEAIKIAMAWDEAVFHLNCELSQHMVAGVDKYASGASEPTGLNLFNTENLFATPQIKTDVGMLRVLEVVAHEFFHYWSGNRVTIRDWFNLPFKEGLTTFRAAMLFEDLLGTSLARLLNGKNLDDKAPRQSSYSAVRSLYTIAAYEKAADVFRMMMLIVGRELFYVHMSGFLKDNDGKAVTIEDMLRAMTQSTGIDLNSFLPWFTEPGIPNVYVQDEYDIEKKQYLLKIKVIDPIQRPIPILIGLLNESGVELVPDTLLVVNESSVQFQFDNVPSRPIPSLLRDFSAPIYLHHTLNNDDLLVLMQSDTNLYNRCDAAKRLIINLVSRYCDTGELCFPHRFFTVYKALLQEEQMEPWILAELLQINSVEELIAVMQEPKFELLTAARIKIQKNIALELKNEWLQLEQQITNYTPNPKPQFSLFDITDAGMRRLKEMYYSYQTHIDYNRTKNDLVAQFNTQLGNNMTETISSLTLLGEMGCELEMDKALQQFYDYWKEDTHAINYWLRIQAAMHSTTVVNRVKYLIEHPAFDILNPNKIYSLLGTFTNNPYGFHNASGEGYQLIAKMVLILDKINPPLAAHLAQKLCSSAHDALSHKQFIMNNLTILDKEARSINVKNVIKKGIHN